MFVTWVEGVFRKFSFPEKTFRCKANKKTDYSLFAYTKNVFYMF